MCAIVIFIKVSKYIDFIHLSSIFIFEMINGKNYFLYTTLHLVTDGLVTYLDEEEAEEISVKYTPDTEFEHWTIKGGGAGIEREKISASDIAEGMLLEISGHFEDADFIAELVLIEVYE